MTIEDNFSHKFFAKYRTVDYEETGNICAGLRLTMLLCYCVVIRITLHLQSLDLTYSTTLCGLLDDKQQDEISFDHLSS